MHATRARYYCYLLLIITQIIIIFSPVFPRCFSGVSPVFIIIPASALRFGAASLEMQRTLLCAMHSRACANPRRSSETLQRGEHAST